MVRASVLQGKNIDRILRLHQMVLPGGEALRPASRCTPQSSKSAMQPVSAETDSSVTAVATMRTCGFFSRSSARMSRTACRTCRQETHASAREAPGRPPARGRGRCPDLLRRSGSCSLPEAPAPARFFRWHRQCRPREPRHLDGYRARARADVPADGVWGEPQFRQADAPHLALGHGDKLPRL